MGLIQIFFLLYIVSVATMYFLFSRGGRAPMLPGDFYISKGPKRIYIPVGSSLIITIILFILFKLFVG